MAIDVGTTSSETDPKEDVGTTSSETDPKEIERLTLKEGNLRCQNWPVRIVQTFPPAVRCSPSEALRASFSANATKHAWDTSSSHRSTSENV